MPDFSGLPGDFHNMTDLSGRLLAGAAALMLALSAGVTAASAEPREAIFNSPKLNAFLNGAEKRQAIRVEPILPVRVQQRRVHQLPVNNVAADTTSAEAQFNSTIADLGNNNLVAAWFDAGSFDGELSGDDHFVGYGWSDNNGLSWTDAGTLPDSAQGDGIEPSLAHDRVSGAVYLAVDDSTEQPLRIQVYKSTDLGHTFGAPVNGAPGSAQFLRVSPRIAVDNFAGALQGNVYLCWTQVVAETGDATIRFSRSINDGASFLPSNGLNIASGFVSGCTVTVGAAHRVLVSYYKSDDDGQTVQQYVRRSQDGGATFGGPFLVADLGFAFVSRPEMAVNPTPGKNYVYSVFSSDPTQETAGDDDGDIFLVRSSDGVTWSAPQLVNDDTAGNQLQPAIAFAKGGQELMITYQSSSHDPAGGSFHHRARRGALAPTGAAVILGRTSFQLGPDTPIVSDSTVFGNLTNTYNGIAGGDDAISTLWSDSRLPSRFQPFQPDVRFANIATSVPTTNFFVTGTAPAASPGLGESFIATARVQAAAGQQANDVFVNISAPSGLSIRSASSPAGACTVINNIAGCYVGVVRGGSPKTVHINAVGVLEPGNRTLNILATSSTDQSPANNAASANFQVNNAPVISGTATSGTISLAIPDDGEPVGVRFPVQIEGTVVQAVPSVRINHEYAPDLILYLISPLGQVAMLSAGNGDFTLDEAYGSGANTCAGTPTSFDDLAATSILEGTPPFAGTFRPQQPIAPLLGGPADGEWKIVIQDLASEDVGIVGCVTFSVTIAQ